MKNLNTPVADNQVIFVVDGEEILLTEESDPSSIAARIHAAQDMAILAIGDPVSLNVPLLKRILFVADGSDGKLSFGAVDGVLSRDLFDDMLKSFAQPTPHRLSCFKGLIALTIAWLYPLAVPTCSQQFVDRMKELGVVGERRTSMDKLVAKELQRLRQEAIYAQSASRVPVPLAECVTDSPTTDDLLIPPDYRIDGEGVGFHGKESFAAVPIVITNRLVDANDKSVKVRLAWYSNGAWHSQLVSRRTICDARQILSLADAGMPVHSGNATKIIGYLANFEAENEGRLTTHFVSSTLGFHSSESGGVFVLPKKSIAAEEDSTAIEFHSSDPGVQQIVAGFHEGGSFKRWTDAVSSVRMFPAVMLGLYASLVPVLHPMISFPNVIVDYSGRTSGGKTIVLRFAASPWGNPDETSPSSILQTWGSTKTYLERASATINHLPLVVDDTKNAKREDLVASCIYSLTQGRVPGRGTITGIQATGHYQGIVISSGERPITSFSKDGGTRARTISLWGSPFGEFSPSTGETARHLDDQIKAHFGHAGPHFVEFVIRNQERWGEWRSRFEQFQNLYVEWAEADGNQFAARLAPSLAAIALASEIAHECFDFDFEWEDPIEPLWDRIASESAEADQARSALEFTFEWAVAHQEAFDRDGTFDQPPGGFLGRWTRFMPFPAKEGRADRSTEGDWPWIGVLPNALKKILDEQGFDSEAVTRTWWDNGWLESNEPGRRTVKTRIGREKNDVRLIAIKRQALQEVCGIA